MKPQPASPAGIAFTVGAPRRQGRLPGRRIQQWLYPDGTPSATFHRTTAGYAIRFPRLADFSVSSTGEQVECRPVPGMTSESIEYVYLNQVVPLALSRAGRLVFHASAVSLGGHGVAFMGVSGCGKSTLAASLAVGGSTFLADDGLQVSERDAQPLIVPKSAVLRLWEDSAAAVIGGIDAATASAPKWSKVRYFAGDSFAHSARPMLLERVYFLGPGRARGVSIEPLPRGEALIELVRHSFLIDVEAEDVLAAHFSALTNIASRCAFFRLDYPRVYTSLAAVCLAVAEHAGARGGRA